MYDLRLKESGLELQNIGRSLCLANYAQTINRLMCFEKEWRAPSVYDGVKRAFLYATVLKKNENKLPTSAIESNIVSDIINRRAIALTCGYRPIPNTYINRYTPDVEISEYIFYNFFFRYLFCFFGRL